MLVTEVGRLLPERDDFQRKVHEKPEVRAELVYGHFGKLAPETIALEDGEGPVQEANEGEDEELSS